MFQDFPNGLLWLDREPSALAPQELSWMADPVNSLLVLLSAVVLFCDIKDIFVIWRPLVPALLRWKPMVALEHNMQLARTRNRLAVLFVLPVCLCLDYVSLTELPLPAIVAILTGFALLRLLMFTVLKRKRITYEYWTAARHSMYSVFVALAMLMLLSASLLNFLVPKEIVVIVYFAEIAFAYLISLVRELQILSSQCGALRGFLYLCGLELLPASAVISAVILL